MGRARLAALGLAAALVLAPAVAASASAPTSTATATGSDRAAAVQAMLDRVLGPGNAVVTVADTIRTSTASTTSIRWGTGVTGAGAATVVTVSGTTTSKSLAQQNLVGGTSTSTVTPPGALVRRSVSVAVDSAHLGARSAASLKRLVAAAAGITRSRGDSVSLVVTPFAKPAAVVVAPAPSVVEMLSPDIVPAIWVVGGLIAVIVLARTTRGRSKRSTALARQ